MLEWIPVADDWPNIHELMLSKLLWKDLPALKNVDKRNDDAKDYGEGDPKLCEAPVRLTWKHA